jgi:hypothetical protein
MMAKTGRMQVIKTARKLRRNCDTSFTTQT